MSITILLEGDTSPVVVIADTSQTFDDPMRPQTVEKFLFAGDTPTFNILVKEAGVAKNLDGLSLSLAACTTPGSGDYIFNVTPSITSSVDGEANATVQIPLTASGYYTAEITVWGTGVKLTALQFPIFVGPTVA